MKYLDYYEIEIKSGDQILNILPSEYSFALTDSIYSILNTGVVNFHDQTGLLQEYLLTLEKLPVTITYGIYSDENITFSCDYVIDSDSLEDVEVQGLLNGWLDIEIINGWIDKQEIKDGAYNDRISFIIEKLAKSYFSEIDKNDTGNQNIWYQMLMTDMDFIEKILLPNAYSNNANQTPFFCYVTSDNVFHFRNYQSLLNSSPADTITYVLETKDNYKINSTFHIQRWRKGIQKNFDFYKRNIYQIDKDTGDLIQHEDSIKDYPILNPNECLPIYGELNTTSYLDLDYTNEEVGQKENVMGQMYSSISDGLILERMNLTLPFNPKLFSGKIINLQIYKVTSDAEPSTLSENFSGKYLIERCTHIWDGKEQKGYTKIVIGRKILNIPNSYLLKGKLVQ